MRKRSFNEIVNTILIVIYASLMVFTPFYQFQRMVFLIATFFLWFLSTLSIDKRWYWRVSVVKAILVIFFMIALDFVLWQVTGDYLYFNQCITHKIFLYLWFVIFLFYATNRKLLRLIVKLILVLIGISVIITLVGNLQNPGASRLLAGTNEYYSGLRDVYRSKYIGGYDFIYGLVFLTMPLMLWIRNKSKNSLFAIILLAISCVTITVSSYFIGILLLVGFIISVLIKPKNMFRYVITITLLLLIVVILKDYLLEFLIDIGNVIDSEILVKRANELITMSYVSDYGEGNRLVIYQNAFLNYLDQPFLGTLQGVLENHRRSGHSALLVYLENYGLISLVYYKFLYKIEKETIHFIYSGVIKNSYKIFYVFLLIFMFVDIFDTAYMLGCVVFFVAPAILLIIDEEVMENEQEYNKNFMGYK